MTALYTSTAGVIRIPDDLRRLDLDDLWRAIARIHRYGAQVNWTVLQHSHLVAELAPKRLRPLALAHDLSEGLLGDLQSPLRAFLREGHFHATAPYEALHDAVNAEIGRRMGWADGWEKLHEIAAADHRAFHLEVLTLVPKHHHEQFGLDGVARPTPRELAALARASQARVA